MSGYVYWKEWFGADQFCTQPPSGQVFMALETIRSETAARVATLRRTHLSKPAALGLAYVGVAAGRIVGEEVRAYWRLHQLTRALAYPEDEARPAEQEADSR